MTKTDIAWDLSELFPNSTDPSVLKAIGNLGRMAEHFAEKYQRKIGSLSAVRALVITQHYR